MTPEQWQRVRPILETALELDPPSRASFLDEACTDSFLRREVESLIASHEQAGTNVLNRGSLLDLDTGEETRFRLQSGKRIGAYEILGEIAVGGMGAVYCAVRADGQYKQQVALKIVRSELGAELTATRFKNERQILASLNHANIAKILDGGTTAEGVPYFVMELVEGQRIDEYCDAHKLATTERLKLFIQICSAVQYAHQRLIIHRDIKPGNILVNAEGVPKLLDFGIAKILESSEVSDQPKQTISLVRLLTPEYASPEQIKGESITTASDVYSLGVVLYELLTGRTPYNVPTHTPHEISRAVCETEPEKPSTAVRRKHIPTGEGEGKQTDDSALSAVREGSPEKLGKRLSGDLDNIVLMALRKEPQRRYASVEQFAQDIRRHLEHLPVIARNDTPAYRASKFISRHKVGVAVTASVALILLAALAVTMREARIAQRRFNDVRSLANSLIFDVHDSIQDLPGSTPTRKLIVEKALRYLDSLSQESRNDLSLQRELAAAYKRIGDVQGDPFHANLGDTPGALKSYQKALTIRQSAFSSNPGNSEDATAAAESYRLVGVAQLMSGQTSLALENNEHAIQISEQSERARPKDVRVLEELCRDYEAEADMMAGNFNRSNIGDMSAALAFRRKELQIAEREASLDPNNLSSQRGLAVSVTHMGDQFFLDGDRRAALPYYLRAQKAFQDLAAHSQDAKALQDLNGIYTRLQQVALADGDAKQATEADRSAIEIATKLSTVDPQNVWPRLALAQDYGNLTDALSRIGDTGEALTAVNKGLAILAQLVALDPKNTEFRGMQAAVYTSAGDAYSRSGNTSQALHNYREALFILSQILSEDSGNVDGRLRLAGTSNKVGSMLARLKDLKGATEMYDKALQLAQQEVNSNHPNEEALYSTADSYAGLGEVGAILAADTGQGRRKQIEHWNQARLGYERSLKIWTQIKEPGLISPGGFDCIPQFVVTRQLARCNQALQRLGADARVPRH